MYIAKLGPRPWLEIAFSPACKSNCSDASNVVKTFIELGSSTFCSSCGRANLQQSPSPGTCSFAPIVASQMLPRHNIFPCW